ncbi:ATP-binding protein [Thalassotalea fusca]
MRLFHTLKYRILISAVVMVLLMLPLIGLTIINAYEKHMQSGIKSELTAYSYSILALAEVEEQQLIMPEQLLENRFNAGQSGLYALFVKFNNALPKQKRRIQESDVLWRSPSYLGFADPKMLPNPNMGEFNFTELIIQNEAHFLLSLSVNFSEVNDVGDNIDTPMVIHIVYQKEAFELQMSEFKERLWIVLMLFIMAILLFQVIWLNWTLKPLSTLKQQLAEVEKGKAEHLIGDFPEELQRVTEQINRLLATEQHQRTRYRNALSDLAHSLKTPLAVIQSQSDLSELTRNQLASINKIVEHQLKRAQSAGQSAWHMGIEIKPVAEKLLGSLQKIYRDKALEFTLLANEKTVFRGEEGDLLELLGNLLDNAAKAACAKVQLSVNEQPEYIEIIVEDDGLGIAPNKVESIFNRGMRADTYETGHGVGLAIVRDLVESYQGSIAIQDSHDLRGACFKVRFNKASN